MMTHNTKKTETYHKYHRRKCHRLSATHSAPCNHPTNTNSLTCTRTRATSATRRAKTIHHHQHHHHHHHHRSTSATAAAAAGYVGPLCRSLPSVIMIAIVSLLATSMTPRPSNAQQGSQQRLLLPQQTSYLLVGHNMENLSISELTPVGSVVYTLKAADRSTGPQDPNRRITYALTGDTFSVDEDTGEVRLIKQLDRERQAQISTVVNVLGGNSEQPLESKRRIVTVEDADDSYPVFLAHKSASLVNEPALGQYVFQADIGEQAPPNSIVISEMLVTDADEGPNAEIAFECRRRQSVPSDACDSFAIESRRLAPGRYSVSLRTRQLLDYERHQSYRLSLVARGKRPSPLRGVPLESEAVLAVSVLNVQDEGPVFVNAPYSLSMFENTEPNRTLLSLIVQDGDLAPQRRLTVIVPDEPFKDYFSVVQHATMAKIWHLETNGKTLDREDPRIGQLMAGGSNMLTFNLLAAELGPDGAPVASEQEILAAVSGDPNYNKALLKREQVSILLVDQPDTAPVFVRSSAPSRPLESNFLVVNVSESLASGTSVPNLDLAVLDLDQGENSRFSLRLVDGELGPAASEALALESEIVNGKAELVLNVLNSSLLDYEIPARRVYRFALIASKLGVQHELSTRLDVQLQVQDANDNWPEFEREQYTESVPEASSPGYLVAIIRAQDRDSGAYGRVAHRLLGYGADKFSVNAAEGKIFVADCALAQCLDYELQPSYALTYEARDAGGHSQNVSLIINVLDANDHAPKFTELVYKRELISDNLSSRQNYISPQLIVRAKDDDGPTQGRHNITYRMARSNLTGLDVEPSSGLVYLSQPLDLDAIVASLDSTGEAGAGAARDLGAPGSLDGEPGGDAYQHQFRHQRKIVFEAEVVAEDNGTPPLNSSAIILLVVKGNRDGAPQFKQQLYRVHVRENQPPARPFFEVQAVDPDDKDSQLRYSLGYDPSDLVAVDAESGKLSFKSRVDFDDFRGTPYNITVYATDNSRPYPLRASTVVSILVQDVNNKAPRFGEPEYKSVLVQGRTRPGDVVLQVSAADLDLSARLNYSILVDQMTISDRDGAQFSLDDIANATSGYLAQMVRAERLRIVGELKRLLSIDSATGAIELKSEPDYSLASSISFRVRVVDSSQEIHGPGVELPEDFAGCALFLQAHIDKSPVFALPWTIERRHYNISILEELTPGTPIFSLLAKDPATNQRVDTYEKIRESDPRNYFSVERSSGLVLVNRLIDYEELPAPKRLSVAVRALAQVSSDGSSSGGAGGDSGASGEERAESVASINIQVVDLNDNAPQFLNQSYSAAVSEAITSAHEILTVAAEDKDSAEFAQVYYSLSGYSSHLFAMHPRKGSLTLRKNARLDRDTEPSYYLIATASDCNETAATGVEALQGTLGTAGGVQVSPPVISASTFGCKRSSVPIEITVLDENDNDPQFVNTNKRGEYEATSSETISAGSVITQVSARDLDEGPNGQVAYEIVRTDDPITRLLSIDSEGYIRAGASLAGCGRVQPYRLTVRAYDLGAKQSRQAFASLLLTISDVVANDGVPRFVRPRPDEIVTIPENAGPSTLVYQVLAVDPDEEAAGKVMYKFAEPSDTFEINPFDGVIQTKPSAPSFLLDRELVPNYTLIIVAQDLGSPQKQAHQVLTIRISDINDNEPYFERAVDDPPVRLYVDEEVPRNTLIGTIQAIDKDVGNNAIIGYDIIEGNTNNLFRLSWDQPEQQVAAAAADGGASASRALQGNNPCRIYSTGRLDRETRESYTLTIKATSMSKMRNHQLNLNLNLRDPLAGRANPFNAYNASDLTKIRVTIQLLDINDNRPVFAQPGAKSVIESSAEVYSQLMAIRALDADSSSLEMRYSILDALYYSDSKFKPPPPPSPLTAGDSERSLSYASMRHVFDLHPTTGILRNSISLRPFTDGYFEIFVKADSGGSHTSSASGAHQHQTADFSLPPSQAATSINENRCATLAEQSSGQSNATTSAASSLGLDPSIDVTESCHVAITKVVVFVTHQRETFRFVFNKTKLNDRLDEFKEAVQRALEDMMFEPAQVQASIQADQRGSGNGLYGESQSLVRAEKVFLNTFNTDYYERDDGSLDFSTITSCSQLVKFDDRAAAYASSQLGAGGRQYQSADDTTLVPNQVVSYDDVVSLLKTLNTTQASRQQQQQQQQQLPNSQQQQQQLKPSLFSQYGLVKIERCLPDRTMYKMTLSERLALYFAAMIALVSMLLAFIVSKMRKKYEKSLKILQRSKYQYMGAPYA